MQVSIDPTRCQGHALCLEQSHDNFDFDDVEGRGFVTESVVRPQAEESVRRAAANCPERAINIS
jgi:ferredoxin